jgi:hypothetical protein
MNELHAALQANDKPATWPRAALIGTFAWLVCWAIVKSMMEVWL